MIDQRDNLNPTDVNNLVQYINLMMTRAEFRFTAQEALEFASLSVQMKDLKDKLDIQISKDKQPLNK